MIVASVRKRGAYQWQARVIRVGAKPISKTFTTKQAAEDWATQTERDIASERFVDVRPLSNFTLDDLLADMLKTAIPPKKSRAKEESFVRCLRRRPIAKMTLPSIDEYVIKTYRDERLKEVAPGSVLREMAVLSSYYNYAASEIVKYRGLHNPVSKVRRPQAGKRRRRRISDEEIDYLLKHSDSELLNDLLPIAAVTAMRRSEVMKKLMVEHIDMENRTIDLFDTKNGLDRTVPFPVSVKPIIERRIAGRTSGRLFTEGVDAPSRAFARARKRARKAYEKECAERAIAPSPTFLVDVRLHDARHEATTRLFEVYGLSLPEAASVTGHLDYKVLRSYTHMEARRIAQKMG